MNLTTDSFSNQQFQESAQTRTECTQDQTLQIQQPVPGNNVPINVGETKDVMRSHSQLLRNVAH